MENATDALKIAFAILVFVVAISITFSVIAQAKKTSDVVLFYNDKTNFRDNKSAMIENNNGGIKVDIGTVISTINRCKIEKLSVTVIDQNANKYIFDKEKYNNELAMINDINNFVKKHKTGNYIEYFSESIYRGQYLTGNDGTTLTVVQGESKIYITYKYTE